MWYDMWYDIEDWLVAALMATLTILVVGGLAFAILGKPPEIRCVNGTTTHGRMYVSDGCVRVDEKVFCGNVTVTPGKCK